MNLAIRIWLERQTITIRERFIERAAIMEYDGGLSREEAEDAAFKQLTNAVSGSRRLLSSENSGLLFGPGV